MADIKFIDVDAPQYAGSPKPLRDAVAKLQNLILVTTAERDAYRAMIHPDNNAHQEFTA